MEEIETPPAVKVPKPWNNARERMVPYEKAGEFVNQAPVSRNEPCPCGSGLKFKKCHGSIPSPVVKLATV